MLPRLTLAQGRSRPIDAGHPWIFAGALDSRSAKLKLDPGAWVEVCADGGASLGVGLYSPNSTIRVRMVEREVPEEALNDLGVTYDEAALAFWRSRIEAARDRRLRDGASDAPDAAWRVVNSEGDGLPGLVVDRFGEVVTVQVSTLPMELRRPVLLAAITEALKPRYILLADPERAAEQEGFEPCRGWHGPSPGGPVVFREGVVRFALTDEVTQKTGHFLDVGSHRAWVAARCAGLRVFDGYCFTGGFGLHAAVAGAASVLAVDSSAPAIAQAQANLALQEDGESLKARATFVADDVRNQLRSSFDRGRVFDVVILDPPKFAPRKQDVPAALKSYTSLLIEALRVVAPGGLLGISSCSHHIGEPELVRALSIACGRVSRPVDVVHVAGQTSDHPYPVAMTEGRYLSFVFARTRGEDSLSLFAVGESRSAADPHSSVSVEQ